MMIFLEAALSAVLVLLLTKASISDLKTGKIPNRSILIAVGLGIWGIVPYYAVYATDCLQAYAANNLLSVLVSLILYASGIWGAGDCKLLCAAVFLLPARLYCFHNRSMVSCFSMIALIFLSAFVYVIGETIFLGIRRRDLFQHSRLRIDIRSYLHGFGFYFFFLSLSDVLLSQVIPSVLLNDTLFLMAVHFVLVLLAMQLAPRASWTTVGIMAAVWSALLLVGVTHFALSDANWKIYIVVILLAGFRTMADKYNYQTIDVSKLKPGMILSLATVMLFSGSRVQGLPVFSSEDLRSRLTPEEVESVRNWAKSKYGCDTIIIVRKIPFALFIAIGTVLFTVLEVLVS